MAIINYLIDFFMEWICVDEKYIKNSRLFAIYNMINIYTGIGGGIIDGLKRYLIICGIILANSFIVCFSVF